MKKQQTSRTAEIIDYRVEKISLSGGRTQPKLIIKVKTNNEQEFEISEIFFKKGDDTVCQGLWINLNNEGEIAAKSTLNALMEFYDTATIEELKGLYVRIKHNAEGYYTIDCTPKEE